MSETPPFAEIAERIANNPARRTEFVAGLEEEIEDALRQVWNARGAADIEQVKAKVMTLSNVYIGSAAVRLETTIRSLDR